jgi:hypothetical protein
MTARSDAIEIVTDDPELTTHGELAAAVGVLEADQQAEFLEKS